MRNLAIVVAWQGDSPRVSTSCIEPKGNTFSPENQPQNQAQNQALAQQPPPPPRQKTTQHQQPLGEIYVILGGFAGGGESSSARKAHLRSIRSAEIGEIQAVSTDDAFFNRNWAGACGRRWARPGLLAG